MKRHLNMPEIQIGDYRLRNVKKSDYVDMFDYGSDPLVTRYLNWGPFTHENEAKRSISGIFMARPAKGLPIGYAIVDTLNGKMIGTIDFHSPDRRQQVVEIGFVLNRAYWNKGIMTNALKAIIPIGFHHLGYQRLKIRHLIHNVQSQRVIEKAGFTYVSTEAMIIEKNDGIRQEMLRVYTLDKEDYHGIE
jgi:[ribosomal protein S5]-alanine N-acetyltransferase